TTLTLSRGTGSLVRSEARLFLRDGGSLFFALAFPAIVLVGVGLAIPGLDEPLTEGPGAGLPSIVVMLRPVRATAMATAALSTVPSTIAGYREQGVLTRLSTTPMRPTGLLLAQLVIGVVAFLLATMLALVVGSLVFTLPVPQDVGVVLAAVLLGAVAMFSVGMIIAARATKASTAQGIGILVYFPMLFFAGMWTPGPVMPDVVAAIATWTPLGAISQAISAGWLGGDLPWLQLAVTAGYAVLGIAVAARLFRWS